MLVVTDRRNGLVQHLVKQIPISIHPQHHIHRVAIQQHRQTNTIHHRRLEVIGHHWHRCQKRIGLPRKNLADGFADVADRHRRKLLDGVQHGILVGVTGNNRNPAALKIGKCPDGRIAGADEHAIS